MTKRWVIGVLGCMLAVACADQPNAAATAVQRRAPTDLRCASVAVTRLSKTAYVAQGCDSEATYTCRCVEFIGPYNICKAVACTPDIVRMAETSGGSSATPARGCEYDTQCKGDRICRAGQCVDPAPRPVSSDWADPWAAGEAQADAQR